MKGDDSFREEVECLISLSFGLVLAPNAFPPSPERTLLPDTKNGINFERFIK